MPGPDEAGSGAGAAMMGSLAAIGAGAGATGSAAAGAIAAAVPAAGASAAPACSLGGAELGLAVTMRVFRPMRRPAK